MHLFIAVAVNVVVCVVGAAGGVDGRSPAMTFEKHYRTASGEGRLANDKRLFKNIFLAFARARHENVLSCEYLSVD